MLWYGRSCHGCVSSIDSGCDVSLNLLVYSEHHMLLRLWSWQLCWVDSDRGDALFVESEHAWLSAGGQLPCGLLKQACFAWHVASLQTFVSASTQVVRVACSFGCGWPSVWHLWFLSLHVLVCVMNSSPTQKKKKKKQAAVQQAAVLFGG